MCLLPFDVRLCPSSGPVVPWSVVSEVVWLGTVCLVELLAVLPTAPLSVTMYGVGVVPVVVVVVVVDTLLDVVDTSVIIVVIVVDTSVVVIDILVLVCRAVTGTVNGILIMSPCLRHQKTLTLIRLVASKTRR